MAIDRDDILRKAEKLLRQGRLDAAVAEYERVVEDQPRDWATANLLGDLYVRAGQVERAVAQYARIADQLAREGFLSKATALYKKIVKIHPADDTALLRAAELASQQGLGADARGYLQSLFQQRLRRGDRVGAGKIAVRLAEVDPHDAVGRLEAARMLAEMGETVAAADQLRAAGEALCVAGKIAEGIRAWREALRFSPADAATRSLMVRALLDLGDPDAAREVARQAIDLRAVAEGLERAGRGAEALGALEQALAAEPGNQDLRLAVATVALRRREFERAQAAVGPSGDAASPGVQLVRAELDLRSGRFEEAASALARCLSAGPEGAAQVEALAARLAAESPHAGFSAMAALLERAEAMGDVDPAIAALERFVAAVPMHVPALERLVGLCADTLHHDQQYRAGVLLADAYLADGRWDDGRVLAERLLALRPEHDAHYDRLVRALTGLGVPMPAAVATAHRRRIMTSGEMTDVMAGLPAAPAVDAHPLESPALEPADAEPADPEPADPEPADAEPADAEPADAEPADAEPADAEPADAEPAGSEPPPPDESFALDLGAMPPVARGLDLDEPIEFSVPRLEERAVQQPFDPLPPQPPPTEAYEIDLSGELEQLLAEVSGPSAPGAPGLTSQPPAPDDGGSLDLEDFFQDMRESSGREGQETMAARAYDRASQYYNQGDVGAAEACLREAVRDETYRFRAGSMLARVARERGEIVQAVEWLERAAEAPAPTLQAAHALLYELADTLEAAGEPARALAVFLELRAAAPGYRDVAARTGRLSTGHGGGAGPRRRPA